MDKETDEQDEEEDGGLGESDGAEEHPVDRREVQLAKADEDESRQGEGANKGAQSSGFNITDEIEFPCYESKEDNSKALDEGGVEVVEAGVGAEDGGPVAHHGLDGQAHRRLHLVSHHGCLLSLIQPLFMRVGVVY